MAMIEFSQEWKSGFPIDTVSKAPLLLSKETSESLIGPLIFNPIPESLAHLFTSPALAPPLLNPPPHLSLTRFISTSTLADSPLPHSTASSIAFSFGPQDLHFSSPLVAYHRLQFLKCPHDDTVVVFFSTGTNLDRVGFLLLSVKDKSLVATGDQKGGIFTASKSLGSKIVRVLVNPIEDDSFLNGFGIILGSFWNCEFSLFCYGPSFPPRKGSTALEISKFSSCLYAWDHPSGLMLSGDDCQRGDCLVREQFWKEALPEWTDWQQKKHIVLGFGVLNNDLSSLLFEPDEFGGFVLIRLMSSGKLELQRYCASWELVKNIEVAQRDPMLHSEDNLLYFMGDEEYKVPRKFKYFELNYLHAHLNGNLSQVLDSSMAKPCECPHEKEMFSLEFHEVLCKKLKICGFGQFRTSPAITVTFNDINLPTSIHEVALRRMWAELPMEFLQLAFSSYSELHEVLLDQKRVALEFSVVPELPQLPPFFLRKPSNHSSRCSRKVQSSDALVGPALPLAFLSTLHELRNGCPNSQEETGGFSSESELNVRCNEVVQVAKEVAVSDSTTKLQDDNAISLDDDRDDFLDHSEKPKSFLLYHPTACQLSFQVHKEDNCVYQDDKFASMITKVHEKQSPHPEKVETFKLEFFDDLCPIDLKFDAREVKFSSQESKISNLLKKNFSKWQEEFTPYREFCSRFTSPCDKMA
ncbi:PREDICTED: uncharacterized protein LOC105108208 isoform X2 [Populus euphratica]|uniref:Uncharacterized protein LOC105108208 isoform X2 n=1 Tax=Populus euphratica TaxID=75702 RepID=A0AAJ6X0C9_POPEU|nr:PREDICTED: uncharacterized protein LOC105108208 isoform X2 [Populus euphratica]